MTMKRQRTIAGIAAGLSAAAVALFVLQFDSKVQAQNDADPGKPIRCATRLSVSLLGTSPSADLLQSTDPQLSVDAIIQSPEFQERFARYINSEMNEGPGATIEEDSAYFLTKHILQNNKPWKDLFVGAYGFVANGNGNNRTVTVQDDPNGLGYFRHQTWLQRYAGNELTGIKLNTAYRMMHNVVGLTLNATTNAPGADVTAAGRQSPACRSCHYDGWYALDKTAEVLSKVRRQGNNVTFVAGDGQPREVLGGVMVKDDKELITAMANSEQFLVNACRTSFKYLYGREENSCEAELFDRCVEALRTSGLIQNALAVVAKDPSFCQ